jgi:hypothetical protein
VFVITIQHQRSADGGERLDRIRPDQNSMKAGRTWM